VIDISSYLPPLLGAVAGVFLKYLYDSWAEGRRFKRELEDNNHIDVSGDWCAAWQTSVDGVELINCEAIRIVQKGKTVRMSNTERSPDNPKAGYLWDGQMQFFQGRNLMGWYFPRKEENNSSKGIMYMTYLSPQKKFIGQWVGSAYDGELVTGFVVVGKERTESRKDLEAFITAHPRDVRLIYHLGLGESPVRGDFPRRSPG
jgi:hypothetical protein